MAKNSSVNFRSDDSMDDSELDRLADQKSPGMVRELFEFLRENKAWWLTPIILLLLLVSILVFLGGSALAPALYTFW
jgi:Family of unknown function (DUF5989)